MDKTPINFGVLGVGVGVRCVHACILDSETLNLSYCLSCNKA